MAKACAYSCQHRLWRHVGVDEFGENTGDSMEDWVRLGTGSRRVDTANFYGSCRGQVREACLSTVNNRRRYVVLKLRSG